MDYIPCETVPHFSECSEIVSALGFTLVELQIVPQKESVHVTVVIASKDLKHDIGVSDCSKVHHALEARIVEFIHRSEDELYMEVSSPGLERNIKNAAEFAFFTGREVRVWDKNITDWVRGIIKSSDAQSVTLQLEDGSEKTVAYIDIAKAKFIHL